MKFFATALVLALMSLSSLASAQTAQQQIQGLTAAGFQNVASNFFIKGSLAIAVNQDGSYAFYMPYSSFGYDPASIKALNVGTLDYGNEQGVEIYSVDSNGQISALLNSPGGSGGGLDNDKIPALKALVGTPFSQQLQNAGFTSSDRLHKIWTRTLGEFKIVVVADDTTIYGLFKNSAHDEDDYYHVNDKLKGTRIVGLTSVRDEISEKDIPALIVEGAFARYTVTASDSLTITSVEFTKDLSQVSLADLGLKLPAPKKDFPSGFVIGGVNPTSMILNLVSLNGSSISGIEDRAHHVSGCSHGDPLLATGENLVKIMAADNDKVKSLNLTHQDLAKPFLYAQALVDGGLGYDFTLHGVKYEISRTSEPMCGSLDSPFNDQYHTGIMFPRITNLATQKFVDYSYLHPYLINQYGFYGSHQNQSYVSPEAIMDVFEYLKSNR